MFSKNEKTEEQRPTVVSSAPSLISASLEIDGNLKTDGELQIDGVVHGDVFAGVLTVGEKARIDGEILADEVLVRGQVYGRIRAGKVALAKTARVIGDILHNALAIDAGAFLTGNCRHVENPRKLPADDRKMGSAA